MTIAAGFRKQAGGQLSRRRKKIVVEAGWPVLAGAGGRAGCRLWHANALRSLSLSLARRTDDKLSANPERNKKHTSRHRATDSEDRERPSAPSRLYSSRRLPSPAVAFPAGSQRAHVLKSRWVQDLGYSLFFPARWFSPLTSISSSVQLSGGSILGS